MAQQGLAARTWMTVGTLSRFLSEKIEKPGLDDVISIARNLRGSIDFFSGEGNELGRINYNIILEHWGFWRRRYEICTRVE